MIDSAFSPLDLPITLPRKGSWSRTLLLEDEAGNPADLTGWTFVMQVRASAGSPTLLGTGTITTINATGGQIEASLLGSAFDAVPGIFENVPLAHDIRGTKSGELPIIIALGVVTLTPGVTA